MVDEKIIMFICFGLIIFFLGVVPIGLSIYTAEDKNGRRYMKPIDFLIVPLLIIIVTIILRNTLTIVTVPPVIALYVKGRKKASEKISNKKINRMENGSV